MRGVLPSASRVYESTFTERDCVISQANPDEIIQVVRYDQPSSSIVVPLRQGLIAVETI